MPRTAWSRELWLLGLHIQSLCSAMGGCTEARGPRTAKKKKKDTGWQSCTPAIFTIAKTWKLRKCPSIEECTKKKWSMYTMEYDSNKKYINSIYKTNISKETSALGGTFHSNI